MAGRRTSRFTTTLELGHKGAAVIVPFDPATEWGTTPVPVYSEVHGKEMPGHKVRGTLAGQRFDGWIGKRWGRHFLLVSEELQRTAGIAPGQQVEVVVAPLPGGAKRTRRK